ncbi:DMT family transporter [Comamonas antarctica]|uniref:DMT family transporter n=1 Tax=Comamonas antarctica TaxID=2743470 RepID=UPI0028EDDCC3|nr:DMT family transporter [Comamonas antarctica]
MLLKPWTRTAVLSRFSRQEAALLAVTVLWGGTFVVMHAAMAHSGPLFFVGLRFVVAGLATMLVFRRLMAGVTQAELLAGAAIGASICVAYALLGQGLQSIEASRAAFLTALYVPAVPLLQWLLTRRAPHPMVWAGIGLAFVGLLLVSNPGGASLWRLGVGEAATILGAFVIALEILLIGKYAGQVNVQRVTAIQLLVAGVCALAAMPLAGESVPAFSWVWAASGVGLGLVSALIHLTMNWAQQSVSPTRATLIYATDPVWAGIIGRIAGDRLPATALLGAVFIVAGILASELRPRRLGPAAATH